MNQKKHETSQRKHTQPGQPRKEKTRRFCDTCNKFFDLQAGGILFFPVYPTTDLSICPQCHKPLHPPSWLDYIYAHRQMAAEQDFRLRIGRAKEVIARREKELDAFQQAHEQPEHTGNTSEACGSDLPRQENRD